MPEKTLLSGVISFLDRLGVYDVVLPFLLVFTIVFAILEKTRILGVEVYDRKEYTKKNLNAIVAFVLGFLVIASSHLVAAITKISAEIVIVMLLAVFFLLLVGSFYEEGKVGKEGLAGWPRTFFLILILLAILFIFLKALPAGNGRTWLDILLGFFVIMPSSVSASIILMILIVIFIRFITQQGGSTIKNKDENK
ncbi:hypothetical protein HYV79_05035 [Candidatus Woesearchaeota archaeon]|nr:hypothetical protein [Candidatus Woesearchaeota archaeon]